MLLKSKRFQKLGGGRLERIGNGLVCSVQGFFMGTHKDRDIMSLIKRSRKRRGGPFTNEAFMLYSTARGLRDLPGDFAEVGVFRGGSAFMTCSAKGDKTMRLFDTFEGLPKGSAEDHGVFRENQYSCGLDKVKENLADFEGLHFYKGIFPESAIGVKEVEDARYAFAYFDVDLYEGTKACLDFFYPRMTPAGIMMSHDYFLEGVRQAFDDFLVDKPEERIELPTTQCMIIKR